MCIFRGQCDQGSLIMLDISMSTGEKIHSPKGDKWGSPIKEEG